MSHILLLRYTVWTLRAATCPSSPRVVCGHLHPTPQGARRCADRIVAAEAVRGARCRAVVRPFVVPLPATARPDGEDGTA